MAGCGGPDAPAAPLTHGVNEPPARQPMPGPGAAATAMKPDPMGMPMAPPMMGAGRAGGMMAMPPAMVQPAATNAPAAQARSSVKTVTAFGVTGVEPRARAAGRLRGRFR